jgi:hypothetical protein
MSHTSYIVFLYGLHCEFNRVFLCHWQHWTDEQDDAQDSIKHKPLWESYMPKNKKIREELERRNMEVFTELMEPE